MKYFVSAIIIPVIIGGSILYDLAKAAPVIPEKNSNFDFGFSNKDDEERVTKDALANFDFGFSNVSDEENATHDAHVPQQAVVPTGSNLKSTWAIARLSDEETLPNNPRYRDSQDSESRVWPFHMDTSKQGYGSRIYILDSGVRASHVDFSDENFGTSRVEDGYNFIDNTGSATIDDIGHGTNVASLAAGHYFGVAKEAKIIPYKVLAYETGKNIFYHWQDLQRAIKAAESDFLQKKPEVGVINISLETMPLKSREEELYEAIEQAIDKGMHVTLSAGNIGKDRCGEWATGNWIYVGATDIKDNIYEHSNFGDCVDIYAPGENIYMADNHYDMGTYFDSGTSFSAALTAGVIAIIGASNPELAQNPLMMKQYILDTAAKDKIKDLPKGSHNRILQSPVRAKITIDDHNSSEDKEEKD